MINLLYSLQYLIIDTSEWVKYRLLGNSLPSMPEIPDHLKLQFHKEKNGYWVTCTDYPAFMASGDTLDELREAIFDNLLLYFDVPRYLAKKLEDKLILTLPNGKQVLPKEPFTIQVTAVASA